MAKRPPTARIKVVLAEALVVGPNDLLAVKCAEDTPQGMIAAFNTAMKERGWENRVLLIAGDVEFAKVEGSA